MVSAHPDRPAPPHRIHLGALRLENGELVGEIGVSFEMSRAELGEERIVAEVQAGLEEFLAWLERAVGAHG